MAKNEKPQPDPDGVIRLSAGYPEGSETLTGIPIRAGNEERRIETAKGPYICRLISPPTDAEPRV